MYIIYDTGGCQECKRRFVRLIIVPFCYSVKNSKIMRLFRVLCGLKVIIKYQSCKVAKPPLGFTHTTCKASLLACLQSVGAVGLGEDKISMPFAWH